MTDSKRPAQLFLAQQMNQPWNAAFLGGAIGLFSAAAPGKTTANEDAALVLELGPGQGLLAVADGLGGGPEGELASRLALEHFRDEVQRTWADGTRMRTAIINGLEAANEAVLKQGRGSATTMAIMEVQGRNLRPYHVGDSVILVMSNRGRLKHETVSHSPVGYGVESGMLDQDEALHHEERHLVCNVVGSTEMRIEIGPALVCAARDTIVIASDGLVDNLTIPEILEQARKGPLPRATKRLAQTARQRMADPQPGLPSKPDDLTLILFRPGPGSGSQQSTTPADLSETVPHTAADPTPPADTPTP